MRQDKASRGHRHSSHIHIAAAGGHVIKRSVAILALALGACGQPNDSQHQYEQGWRQGHVLVTGTISGLKGLHNVGCTAQLAQELPPGAPAALVSYRGNQRGMSLVIVPLKPDAGIKTDDEVYLNAQHCEAHAEPRKRAH